MAPSDPVEREEPPADPDEWTDEQWIEWLKATDEEAATETTTAPATAAARIVHSTGGQLLGQTMIGVARAIYGQRFNEPVIVEQANSDPEDDQPFTLHLDHEHPDQSTAEMRPEPKP